MRYINIKDENNLDAKVCFEPAYTLKKKNESTVYETKKILKGKFETSFEHLEKENGYDAFSLGEKLLYSDDDVDFEETGKYIGSTKKVFVDSENKAVFNLDFRDQILSPEGIVTGEKDFVENEANIQNETLPVKCTGLTVSKMEAAKRYVFTKHYKIRHINGLTYDFLKKIAERLEAEKKLMFIGSGSEGLDPIVLQKGGKKYRGFLEGRTTEDGYLLLLHLTELDLEDVKNDE